MYQKDRKGSILLEQGLNYVKNLEIENENLVYFLDGFKDNVSELEVKLYVQNFTDHQLELKNKNLNEKNEILERKLKEVKLIKTTVYIAVRK